MIAKEIEIKDCKYLSDIFTETPSHFLINKGITGCGGTTVELLAKRDSIILCPTKNLILSKLRENYLGVMSETSNKQIKEYVKSGIQYKKILATYDALPRLIELIPNYEDYFLLIDEYHLLFNDYSFRDDAILYILYNFKKFRNWAFLTATPLKQEFILKELRDVDQLNLKWTNAVPVNIKIKDTRYIMKELIDLIKILKDRNLHIFLNSVSTIKKIIEKLGTDDYRVVCSENSKVRISNFAKITDPVRKLNFYTSCAFEGSDIRDENGYSVIISDTNISTTVLDISTKIRQVCGRIRNSKYKDTVTLILNTSNHRYAGTDRESFLIESDKSAFAGQNWCRLFNNGSDIDRDALNRSYNKDTFATMYVRKYNDKYFYDENLKSMDLYNYNLISEIYSNTISVFKECSENNFTPVIEKPTVLKGLTWIIEKLRKMNKPYYTYQELEEIFSPLFKEHNLKWHKLNSIKNFFPPFIKKRKTTNKEKYTIYEFKI